MRRIGFLCAWIALAGSLGCASPPPEDGRHRSLGRIQAADLEAPSRVGPFRLQETQEYAQPELGVRLAYRDTTEPRTKIDAYVYPISLHELASLANVLKRERISVVEAISEVASRNGMDAGDGRIAPFTPRSAELPPGYAVVVPLTDRASGQVYRSHGFVAVRDHTFFKLRFTTPVNEAQVETGTRFEDAVELLYAAIRPARAIDPPELNLTVTADVFTATQGNSCAIGAYIVYGSEMLKQVGAGHYLDTFARERAARRALIDYWIGKRAEVENEEEPCASASLDALAQADEAGFFDEYVFEAYGDGTWLPPEGLDPDGFATWANATLPIHDPVTFPGTQVQWKEDSPAR